MFQQDGHTHVFTLPKMIHETVPTAASQCPHGTPRALFGEHSIMPPRPGSHDLSPVWSFWMSDWSHWPTVCLLWTFYQCLKKVSACNRLMCSLDSTRGTWIGSFATVVIAPAGPKEAPDVSDMALAKWPSWPYISSTLSESFAYSASKNNFL